MTEFQQVSYGLCARCKIPFMIRFFFWQNKEFNYVWWSNDWKWDGPIADKITGLPVHRRCFTCRRNKK